MDPARCMAPAFDPRLPRSLLFDKVQVGALSHCMSEYHGNRRIRNPVRLLSFELAFVDALLGRGPLRPKNNTFGDQ
jgi:hypothetical protein